MSYPIITEKCWGIVSVHTYFCHARLFIGGVFVREFHGLSSSALAMRLAVQIESVLLKKFKQHALNVSDSQQRRGPVHW